MCFILKYGRARKREKTRTGRGMAKYKKRQYMEMLGTLTRANEALARFRESAGSLAADVLAQCQQLAICIGEDLEKREEGGEIVGLLEDYCEALYQMSLQDEDTWEDLRKEAGDKLARISGEIRLKVAEDKKEIVFLPYKASMWDSMESVWQAAREDLDCEVYVVPIPYYDRKPDGSLGQLHDEGGLYPDYVPVTSWREYSIEGRRPDVVYIHNPYDDMNLVTTVHPDFYSGKLKQSAKLLVYIPYYITSGGMSESRGSCPVYYHADYIIVQAERFKEYFDPAIPQEKLLALGSPKADRVIRRCQDPPQPPGEWRDKMEGKKVFFYNTSLAEMLGDTAAFLKKMEYVFQCFLGREDACLLWRPHPLLEATFDSMRPQYRPYFDALKRAFVDGNLGIYDTTPDITDTVALCDAYVGDPGSSVTALFGVAGKPMFILNNQIHAEPKAEDWRGEIIPDFNMFEDNEWVLTQGNKLYRAKGRDYRYRFFCDLSEYAFGWYYERVLKIGGRTYVTPYSAQDILVIGSHGIEKRIALKPGGGLSPAFMNALKCGRYLFLIPYKYPALVQYDTVSGSIRYHRKNLDVFRREGQGGLVIGGGAVHKGCLYVASPTDGLVYVLHAETGRTAVLENGTGYRCGAAMLVSQGDFLWFLPFRGKVITRWNPETGETRDYTGFPEDFCCINPVFGNACEDTPFDYPAFYKDCMYLPPNYANMYLKLNTESGEISRWNPKISEEKKGGYYHTTTGSWFLHQVKEKGEAVYRLYSARNRRLYDIDLRTGEGEEVPVLFDKKEVEEHEPGFAKHSEWFRYCCQETHINTLRRFLDGDIVGGAFDREKQVREYEKVVANLDGSCGEKIHRAAMDALSKRREDTPR